MRDRPQDWEARLARALQATANRPYNTRTWNCARFAHYMAEQVSGRTLPYQYQGSLEASVDALFERVPVLLAQRGDVVLADVPEPSLGVCVGGQVLFVSAGGLLTRSLRDARIAWGV